MSYGDTAARIENRRILCINTGDYPQVFIFLFVPTASSRYPMNDFPLLGVMSRNHVMFPEVNWAYLRTPGIVCAGVYHRE